MKYEDAKDFCQWCGKELWTVNGERAKAFCSDDCRYSYHNAQRKLKRQNQLIVQGLVFIQDMMLKDGKLRKDAIEAMREITAVASVPTEMQISCADCGQGRMYMPMAGDVCSFCQGKNWLYKPLGLQSKK